jgi:hypothetical protein
MHISSNSLQILTRAGAKGWASARTLYGFASRFVVG